MPSSLFAQQKNASQQEVGSDPKMDQIRELLLGEHIENSEARFRQINARIQELEKAMNERMDALKAHIDALQGEVQADSRTSFDELSKGIEDLARRIRQIPRD